MMQQSSRQQTETETVLPRAAGMRIWRRGVQFAGLLGGKISKLLSPVSKKRPHDISCAAEHTPQPATEEPVPVGCFGCLLCRRPNNIAPPYVDPDNNTSSGSISAAPGKFLSLPSHSSSSASAGSLPSFEGDSASSARCGALTAAAPFIKDTLVAYPTKPSLPPSTPAAAPAVEQFTHHSTPTGPVSPAAADQAPEVAVPVHQSPQLQQGQASPKPSSYQGSSSWSFSLHAEHNKRSYQEDRSTAVDLTGHAAFPGAQRTGFFAVYDGHGGEEAAEYLAASMLSHILSSAPDALASDPLAVLGTAVQKAEAELLSASVRSGSTLCAALLVDDMLHTANVGDSRAVLGRGQQPDQLTRDHKPSCGVEAARIMSDDPNADISEDGYLYGELGVARDLGSAHIKSNPNKRALIPTPDLLTIKLQPADDFVVLATDGLWDKVENQEAVTLVRRTLATSRDATTAARALVERAQRLESTDNCSVVLLLLHDKPIVLPKSNSRLFKRTVQVSADGSSPSSTESSSSSGSSCNSSSISSSSSCGSSSSTSTRE